MEKDIIATSKILIVDDQDANVLLLERLLQHAGYKNYLSLTDSRGLLDQYRLFQPDLIILDLMMPRENATTNFQNLRQRRPGIPILLCTGLPQADPAPELLRSGAVGLLRKPFRMNELWYAVRQGLSAGVPE